MRVNGTGFWDFKGKWLVSAAGEVVRGFVEEGGVRLKKMFGWE